MDAAGEMGQDSDGREGDQHRPDHMTRDPPRDRQEQRVGTVHHLLQTEGHTAQKVHFTFKTKLFILHKNSESRGHPGHSCSHPTVFHEAVVPVVPRLANVSSPYGQHHRGQLQQPGHGSQGNGSGGWWAHGGRAHQGWEETGQRQGHEHETAEQNIQEGAEGGAGERLYLDLVLHLEIRGMKTWRLYPTGPDLIWSFKTQSCDCTHPLSLIFKFINETCEFCLSCSTIVTVIDEVGKIAK